jgi:hypothetical protein
MWGVGASVFVNDVDKLKKFSLYLLEGVRRLKILF